MKQHEWEKVGAAKLYTACKHCDLGRFIIRGEITYERDGKALPEEPDCIERPDKEAGKTNDK